MKGSALKSSPAGTPASALVIVSDPVLRMLRNVAVGMAPSSVISKVTEPSPEGVQSGFEPITLTSTEVGAGGVVVVVVGVSSMMKRSTDPQPKSVPAGLGRPPVIWTFWNPLSGVVPMKVWS